MYPRCIFFVCSTELKHTLIFCLVGTDHKNGLFRSDCHGRSEGILLQFISKNRKSEHLACLQYALQHGSIIYAISKNVDTFTVDDGCVISVIPCLTLIEYRLEMIYQICSFLQSLLILLFGVDILSFCHADRPQINTQYRHGISFCLRRCQLIAHQQMYGDICIFSDLALQITGDCQRQITVLLCILHNLAGRYTGS